MTWQELIRQTNSNNDSELVWSTTEAQLAEADRKLLQAFADELVRKMQGTILTRAGIFVLKGKIHELLTEAGVER